MKQNKINIKVIAVIVYFILFFSVLIYQNYTTTKVVERADREIQRQKAYSEQIRAEEEAAASSSQDVKINTGLVQQDYTESVPSTDLFLKAVQAEKGGQAQQNQPQILDYGAQVAAYEAQANAQKATAARQAPTGQVGSPVSVPSQMGTAAVNNTNTSPRVQAEKQQETKLNKLETRRIFK